MSVKFWGIVIAIGCILYLPGEGYSQNCVLTGLNNTSFNSPCNQACRDLTFQIPDIRSTSTYTVVSIPYNPYPFVTANGTEDPKLYNDDQYSAVFNLPFPFCFYDSVYRKAVISSNGLVTFDTSYASCPSAAWFIASAIPYHGPFDCSFDDYPRSSIMAAFMDIDPRPGPLNPLMSSPPDRKIEWRVEGSAPCRRFVVSYYHIGAFQLTTCGQNPDSAATFQIVMYESTGLIDVFIQHKSCEAISANGTLAILGVQDFSRTKAVAAPGKNATAWTSTNEGYRFVPSGGVSRFVSSELLSMNLTHIAWANSSSSTPGLLNLNFPNICSSPPSTKYIVRTIFSACDDPSVQLTSMDTITVNITGSFSATTTTTNASCGSSSGTITVNVDVNALPPFNYAVDNGAPITSSSFTQTFTNLAPGLHTISVKDANGCIFSTNAIINNNNNGPSAVVVTTTDVSCGASNGTITIGTVTGGTSPYSFSLDGGTFSSTVVYNNLSAGSHTIVVKDANGCTFPTIATINNNNGPTAVAVTTTDASCGAGNGTIAIGVVTGGTSPYSFSLDGDTFSSTVVYNSLSAGSHIIIVKDANGCTLSTGETINNNNGPTAVVVTSTDASCGASNGTITIGTVTGGVSPYSFSLDGGTFSSTVVYNNLSTGSHIIIVKDANGCTLSTNATINNNNGPTAVVITSTDASCGASNGTITIGTVTGGASPFSFSLDGGTFSSTVVYNNLSTGSHTIIVKDANGCTLSTSATINNNNGPTAVVITSTDASCGASNGTITIGNVTGGASPFSFSLDGGAFSSTVVYNNLSTGSHTIIVKDANGCTLSTSATINNNNNGPTAVVITSTDASCGASNGTITIGNVTGGTSPYSYSLDGGAFTSALAYNNLSAGSHTIIVKDINGCIHSSFIEISESPSLTINATTEPASCNGGADGKITVFVNGGSPGYRFSIDGVNFQSSNSFNVTAGNFTVTAKDQNNCMATTNVTVGFSSNLTLSLGNDTTICVGESTQLIATTNATNITWTPAASLNNSSIADPVASPIVSTQYIVTAKLGNCSLTGTTRVTVVPSITVFVSPRDSIVTEGDHVQLNAISIGTSYNWTNSFTLSNPNISNPIAAIPTGSNGNTYNYTVTASTSAGCKGTASVTLRVYKGPDIYVPTGFTPNDDGKNDKFYPITFGMKNLNYFQVFNRWGQMVFSSTTLNEGWDGKFAGIPQPGGVYVWIVQAVTRDNKVITQKGTMMLIR